MTKSLRAEDEVVASAYGLIPTATAALSRAVTGYEAVEESADLLIPTRGDLTQLSQPAAAYALARAETVARQLEASDPSWPSRVPLLLEAGRLRGGAVDHEPIDPLEDGGVLDEFLALAGATRGLSRGMAIKRFADCYGFLGLPVVVVIRGLQVHAELLSEWANEVDRLHRLDQLWRLLVRSRGDHRTSWDARQAAVQIRECFENQSLNQSQQLAEHLIAEVVNQRLAFDVQVGVSRRGRLTWMPRTLLAVIYLKFAGRVLGAVHGTRPCKVCGTPIPPDQSRKRQFCSDKCRSKHHRALKAAQKEGGVNG